MGACLSTTPKVSEEVDETDARYPTTSGSTGISSSKTNNDNNSSSSINNKKNSKVSTTSNKTNNGVVKNPEQVASMIATSSASSPTDDNTNDQIDSNKIASTSNVHLHAATVPTNTNTNTNTSYNSTLNSAEVSDNEELDIAGPTQETTIITSNSSDDDNAINNNNNDSDNNNNNNNRLDPLSLALKESGRDILFLDGGLGTHTSELGGDVNGALWASKLLVTNPDLIKKAHLNYLNAGCNIIESSTYQASFKGFNEMYEYDQTQSAKMMIGAVNLMSDSVISHLHPNDNNNNNKNDNNSRHSHSHSHHSHSHDTPHIHTINTDAGNTSSDSSKLEPKLLAVSIGAYGAHLCDGSEYRGYDDNDSINEEVIREYHINKMNVFMGLTDETKKNNNIDTLRNEMKYDYNKLIFACETVPCVMEVKVLSQVLNELEYYGWISMSVKSGTETNSGESIADAVQAIMDQNSKGYVVGIGINCSSPQFMSNIIKIIKNEKKWDKHILIYPNNGKEFDTEIGDYVDNGKEWNNEKYAKHAVEWHKLGADIIGGCCLTNPDTIKAVRKAILGTKTE